VSQFDPAQYSKRYKRALTFAILLFLGTLTASILVTILSTADRRSLEEDYQMTLTAISTDSTQRAVRAAGGFPFRAHAPTYSAVASCDAHILSGLIRDQTGDPLDYMGVQVWGDYMAARQVVRSGEGPDAAPGRWQVTIPGVVGRHVWVQIVADASDGTLRYLSPPVAVVFEAGSCARYYAEVIFEQVAPVE
jgi:hypothetical protein